MDILRIDINDIKNQDLKDESGKSLFSLKNFKGEGLTLQVLKEKVRLLSFVLKPPTRVMKVIDFRNTRTKTTEKNEGPIQSMSGIRIVT